MKIIAVIYLKNYDYKTGLGVERVTLNPLSEWNFADGQLYTIENYKNLKFWDLLLNGFGADVILRFTQV